MNEQVGHPKVQGRCPSCGSESLFLGSNGYVTCSIIGCKEPGAATDVLSRGLTAFLASQQGETKRWTEVLCMKCGGNGVVKIPNGVSVCPRCDGRCYEPDASSEVLPRG